jgi:hypothetical protein
MTPFRSIIAGIAFASVVVATVPAVWAGAQDTGELASCEIAGPKGIPILGSAGATINLSSNLAAVTFQTRALERGFPFVVIRAMVGLDIGTSSMENVCQMLHGPTAEGGPTLAEQILAAVHLPNRTIQITKRGIFGCDVLPCPSGGRHPDFALVPGSDLTDFPATTALGDVVLFAVRP